MMITQHHIKIKTKYAIQKALREIKVLLVRRKARRGEQGRNLWAQLNDPHNFN